ncbi:Arf GTPase activating protein [Dillenia turbinata]|uniref:Arf GTPase activating protein n=1 Tax=Dillenia turbinata TaxID=194707 RepID=A0AAN8ZQD5_9MAGN
MGSRKEEERNEKIIRGLMKLPPNRRCINCNSLGPQYVCTNFWTFVCITCSGIHREFTHRVKSVSMAKFTSQEVESLQKGGNQRAREIFLGDWDAQRLRLPDSSNVERVREFIKSNVRNLEDGTRRASSYHSYSQSPPYDYQYEERRYGKHGAILTRKPGSDRGHYEGKVSSFVYSPGRLSEQMYEDGFANEGSVSGVSNYSFSSGSVLTRSNAQSPNFQRDIGFGNTPVHNSRDIFIEARQHHNANTKRDPNGIPRPQRTASLGSIGSFDSNSMSLKSVDSGTSVDTVAEPVQDKASALLSIPLSSTVSSGSIEPFEEPFKAQPLASSVDFFQLPPPSQPVDLFEPSLISSVPSANLNQSLHASSSSSLNFFNEIALQQPVITLDKKSPQVSGPKNEGWATFDMPQHMASGPSLRSSSSTANDGHSLGNLSLSFPESTTMQWPSFQTLNFQGSSPLTSNEWPNAQASSNSASSQSWNAFEDPVGHLSVDSSQCGGEPQISASSVTSDEYFHIRIPESCHDDRNQIAASDDGILVPEIPFQGVAAGSPYVQSVLTSTEATCPHAADCKSTNPFDLPYEVDSEPTDTFLDMSSLQSVLGPQLRPSFLGGINQPWFPQNPVTPFIPAAQQGSFSYMSGQAPSPQLQ